MLERNSLLVISSSPGLQMPQTAPRPAQQPVRLFIVQDLLFDRVPFEPALQLERQVPENAQRGHAMRRLYVHYGFLARADAVLEILRVPRAAEYLHAVGGDFVILGLLLGIGGLPVNTEQKAK